MQKLTILAVVAAFSAATGCVPQPDVIPTLSQFDPKEAAYVHGEGEATVEGQAFLRTTVGEVRTCAGAEVSLIPVTRYSSERMRTIYGNTTGGRSQHHLRLADTPDPRYVAALRNTICDAEGDFVFENVPAGQYFVVTAVTWQVPISQYSSRNEGAALMKRVHVTSGQESIRVLLH